MFFDDFDDRAMLELLQDDSDNEDMLDSIRTYHFVRLFFGSGGLGMGDVSFNNSFYYKWSEQNMADSHLLSYTPVAPMFQRTNSINGGHWFIIQSLQEDQVKNDGPGWLEASHVIGHKSIYSLSRQITLLLDAWNVRLRGQDIDWSEPVQSQGEVGLSWFLKQRTTREKVLSVEERARQSVERGMVIFRSKQEFQEFYEETKAAVNLIPHILMKMIQEAIPIRLPYTALSLICKYVLETSDCCSMKLLSENLPSKLVESRYVAKLYLSLLDIFNVLTELMFRHPGETAAPNFPDKFLFLRNIVQRNQLFLETYYHLTQEDRNQFLRETKVRTLYH